VKIIKILWGLQHGFIWALLKLSRTYLSAMHIKKPQAITVVLSCLVCIVVSAQDSSKLDRALSLPDKFFGALDKKTSSIEGKLDKQTDKYLTKLERQESKLKRKLYRKDSALAKELFSGVDQRYDQLKNTSGKVNRYASQYSGHLDSLSTALSFLKSNDLVKGSSISNLSNNPSLQKSLDQYKQLQSKLNASDQIRKQLLQREQLLKEQFQKLGMVKELKKFRKQVYYYQSQVREYKELFENPSKLEAKLMEVVLKLPQFRDFFAKNSLLGSLFALPSSSSSNSSTASLQGLQTRAMVNQSLVDRFGSGPSVMQQLQQNVQSAQGQLNQLKSKLSSLKQGSYGNTGKGDIPGFKPNTQKTKSFLNRIEYGGDVQSQKARYFFPVTSDIALSLGYKLNDKSSIGVGASYKIGWGSNWNNLNITHQGVGLRSYVDLKIKGSFYVAGGYEQNYRAMINSIDQLRDYSAWQSSGLVGLSKRYQISKKMKGEMKLLWDFLSYQQVPRTQAMLFRVGYSLK
jgi:hypothetical protein